MNMTSKKILISISGLILGLAFILPQNAFAASNYATITVSAKDASGTKVTSVNFNVYEQLTDINNQKVFGSKAASGKIGSLGSQNVKVNMGASTSKTYAIEYYIGTKQAEKFTAWDVNVKANETASTNLVLSSVGIVLKNADNELMKDYKFDIYTSATDVNNKKIASEKIYSGLTTGATGKKTLYLVPGDYFLRVNLGLKNVELTDQVFTVSSKKNTDLNYVLSDIKIGVQDGKTDKLVKTSFKLYKKETSYGSETVYKEIGSWNTSDSSMTKIYVPEGDYKLEINDPRGKYARTLTFSLSSATEKEIIYTLGTFRLKILDPSKNPVTDKKVEIYKTILVGNVLSYSDKVFEARTNLNGAVEAYLDPGNYYVKIEGVYYGTKAYTTSMYIDLSQSSTQEYVLSTLRLYLDNRGTSVTNQTFTVYEVASDNQSTGNLIGTFTTGSNGYSDIFLPPGKYIIKVAPYGMYSIFIQEQKENSIHLTLVPATSGAASPSSTQTTTPSTGTNQNYTVIAELNSLFYSDSDSDGLSDFEETNMYKTNPFKADSDGDGYNDGIEVKYGFNPNGEGRLKYVTYSYGRPRVTSLAIETEKARFLKEALQNKLGTQNLGLSPLNWNKYVKAYIYGGYTIDEIYETIKFKAAKVHALIPASAWRTSDQYGATIIIGLNKKK